MNTSATNKQNEQKSEEIDLNHFYYLLAFSKEAKEYVEKLKKYFNEYYFFNTTQYNTLNRLYYDFSSCEDNSNFIGTPIYQVESALKKLFQIQLKMFESFSQKFDIVDQMEKEMANLENIIIQLSPDFNQFSMNNDYSKETNSIFNSLMKTMNDLENKTVDEYIWKKYEKHLDEVSDEKVDNLVAKIKNLEKKMIHNAQNKKNQYFFKIKEKYDTIHNIYNNIKLIFDNYIIYIKELNNNYIYDLESLINEMKPNLSKKNINSNENIIISKSDFELNEKDFFSIKYKINILNKHIIPIKNNNNDDKDEINNKEKKLKTKEYFEQKNKKFYQEKLILTRGDIYEIISKLYSYDLRIIDKSNYILEQEKEKLIASDLSNKLLSYSLDNDSCKNKLIEEYNEILESINTKIVNNIENIYSFLFALNNFRVNSKLQFNEIFYDIVVYIFNKGFDILIKHYNNDIENLIIILSQTYFKEINGTKVYLLEGIKSHDIFKRIEIWKSLIMKSIENEMKSIKKLHSSNTLKMKKKEDIATNKFITYCNLLKELGFSNDKILDLFTQILDKYKFSEDSKNKILSVMKFF